METSKHRFHSVLIHPPKCFEQILGKMDIDVEKITHVFDDTWSKLILGESDKIQEYLRTIDKDLTDDEIFLLVVMLIGYCKHTSFDWTTILVEHPLYKLDKTFSTTDGFNYKYGMYILGD